MKILHIYWCKPRFNGCHKIVVCVVLLHFSSVLYHFYVINSMKNRSFLLSVTFYISDNFETMSLLNRQLQGKDLQSYILQKAIIAFLGKSKLFWSYTGCREWISLTSLDILDTELHEDNLLVHVEHLYSDMQQQFSDLKKNGYSRLVVDSYRVNANDAYNTLYFILITFGWLLVFYFFHGGEECVTCLSSY